MRTCFDVNARLKEQIGRAQNILALIGGIGHMMEPPVTTAMFLGTGKVIGFVVHSEPTSPNAPIVQLDHFRHARSQTGFHKISEHADIRGQQVHVINAAWWYACKTACHVFQRGGIIVWSAVGVPIKFKDMSKGIFKAIGTTMA